MDLFIDILKIAVIVIVAIVAVVFITFENIALRDQNEKKDGDTE